MKIGKYDLVLTCPACPEQYDVFLDGAITGYLRLRHGAFSVEYPDCGGKILEVFSPKGDGRFDEDERWKYLRKAVKLIDKERKNEKRG